MTLDTSHLKELSNIVGIVNLEDEVKVEEKVKEKV